MSNVDKFLESYSTFYRKLSESGQQRFAGRMMAFVEEKEWLGRQVELGLVEKSKIASAAVQLTFGLHEFLLPHFKTIVVYPKAFTPPEREGARHGEVHPGGAVVLSWQAFAFGMGVEDDGKNVALHEFAHALNLSDQMDKEVDRHFEGYWDTWLAAAKRQLKTDPQSMAWMIASRTVPNVEELFAVTVEHFFERPLEFAQQTPEYFSHTARLLNLDPVKPG